MRNLTVVLAVALAVVLAQADEAPVVEILQGRISGVREESSEGKPFFSYYGIPYAKPPVGELRLKDPVPAQKWTGVRDGSIKSNVCLQTSDEFLMKLTRDTPASLVGDEDCLYLNVYTPEPLEKTSNLPVMVYIHGGAFFFGTSNNYLPHVLLNHNIVLVTIQYRLSILGFLSTEDSVIPGNFGLKDQTMALKWVQKNIHNFGGDKTKVTIFGESAGGASVHYQILTPKSQGLFSRAIMQSGTALSPWANAKTHAQTAQKVAEAVGCPSQKGSKTLLQCLQRINAREIEVLSQDFYDWWIFPMNFVPRVDGDYLPEHPAQLVKTGRHQHVDLISGITADDGAFMSLPIFENEILLHLLQSNFKVTGPASLTCLGDSEDQIDVTFRLYQHYLGQIELNEDQSNSITQLMTDRHFGFPHDLATQYHAKNRGTNKVFRYEFTYRGELGFSDYFSTNVGKHWVSHVDDLYYLFPARAILQGDQPGPLPWDLRSQDDLKLRTIMTKLWVNFATTGNPTPDDSLGFTWEPSTEDNLHYLAINLTPTMEADQRNEIRRFFQTLPIKVNTVFHPQLVQEQPPPPPPSIHQEL